LSKKYSIHYLDEKEYDQWNKFIASSPDGSIYSSPEYLDVLCEVTSASYRILTVMKNDEIFGGIALYERPSILGTFVSSRLLLYYNGLVLRDFKTKYQSKQTGHHIEIMTALEERLSKEKYASLCIKNRSTIKDSRVFEKKSWKIGVSYTYVVPLVDLKALWSRIEQNLRRLVKRCSDQGIQFSKDDDFESFYAMHHETHERKGVPLYLPYDQFKRYFERLNSQGLIQIYHARLTSGRPISTQLVLLGPHPIAHTVSAAAEPEFLNMGVNAFLRWKVFEDLSNQGYIGNDLTDAALNPVTHFKSQLGADLELCLTFKRQNSILLKPAHYIHKFLSERKRRLRKYSSRFRRRENG